MSTTYEYSFDIKNNDAGFICKLFNGIISIFYFCYHINESHFYFEILQSREFQIIHSKSEVLIMKQMFYKRSEIIIESLKYFVRRWVVRSFAGIMLDIVHMFHFTWQEVDKVRWLGRSRFMSLYVYTSLKFLIIYHKPLLLIKPVCENKHIYINNLLKQKKTVVINTYSCFVDVLEAF